MARKLKLNILRSDMSLSQLARKAKENVQRMYNEGTPEEIAEFEERYRQEGYDIYIDEFEITQDMKGH